MVRPGMYDGVVVLPDGRTLTAAGRRILPAFIAARAASGEKLHQLAA